jgi:hypothetical protein
LISEHFAQAALPNEKLFHLSRLLVEPVCSFPVDPLADEQGFKTFRALLACVQSSVQTMTR